MSKNFTFNSTPVLRYNRSRFDLSHGVKLSMNIADLVPFEIQEVYAGDTFKVKTACVSRLTSQFFRPIMDNLFLDVYYFFVPSRLLYDKFKNVFGENTESAWANTIEYEVPSVYPSSASDGMPLVSEGTVADYLGLPIGRLGRKDISILPFRAFAKIYNEWFRDQNNVAPMHIQTGESVVSERLNNNAWSSNNYTGKLPKVAKFHDYFTSSLPAPQKGAAVDIPIFDRLQDVRVDTFSGGNTGLSQVPISFGSTSSLPVGIRPLGFDVTNAGVGTLVGLNGDVSYAGFSLYPNNLIAKTSDLGMSATPVSINDLRFAFQYQKMLERDARSGSRYVEYLASHFGVSAGDYRLQRSEFLGGRRAPLSVTQVTQTTGSDNDSAPLAQVGAYSASNSRSRFTKGFVEHGYVLGVACIRQFHTYQQGIERFWTRKKRTDYYDPVFAHIGEQPVYRSELYGLDKNTADSVFGYNEAWADLRNRPSRICGQMRTGVKNSLDVWHLGDYYQNAPTLTPDFIEETPANLDRAITVQSTVQDQFILDFYIQNVAYRLLPTYSVPSLIDHD